MQINEMIKQLKRYDYSFFGISLAIFIVGILNLYSATHAANVSELNSLYITQLMWFGISTALGIVISIIHPKNFFRISYFFFFIMIICLIVVLVLGKVGGGAQRWIGLGPVRFQPSEMMKLALVMALARWLAMHSPEKEIGWKELIMPLIITSIPGGLIYLQPDLGTGLLMYLIFAIVIFFKKIKWRIIFTIIGILLVAGPIVYNFGLREYQRNRIVNFLNPENDVKGTGYNAIQSKIAIGSGQLFGKGFMKSSQASLNYLPENHTDFVFAVFNEEHGLFGSFILICLYLALFLRLIWLSLAVNKMYNSLVVVGIFAIFFWHTFVNMAMVIGIMPIVGLPLPLMSYGGSSLLTFGICNGVATSISLRRSMF